MKASQVGVIGAGVMGTGVAQCCAQAGIQTYLLDLSDHILQKARKEISTGLRFQHLLTRTTAQANPDDILKAIHVTTSYSSLTDVDLVIENVTEDWESKKGVYQQLDRICPPHCIFAVNTSAISITRVAAMTTRPEKVIGLHFMNPAPLKKMVEMIRGAQTSQETVDTTLAFLKTIGKEAIQVQKDMPGFISNRVLMLMINEAIALVQDQVASCEDIDRLFKSCFGHAMGPLETADLIGLDTILHTLEVLDESYQDEKYRPCPLLKKMVDAGHYGRKSQQGFYRYHS